MPGQNKSKIVYLYDTNKMKDKFTTTKWIPLSEIPSASSYGKLNEKCRRYWNNFTDGVHYGVYQISLTRPKSVIHKEIKYIGLSTYLPCRLNFLRTSATPENKVTHHMCGVYIREEKINIDEVYVRCLIPKDRCFLEDIERWLHQEHKIRFKYKVGYAWEEASGGYKSARIGCLMLIKRLQTLDACNSVQDALLKRIAELSDAD